MGKIETGPHIVSAFDDDLMELRAKIAEMGGLAEDMLGQTLEGIERRDAELCAQVVARDARLDRLEREVEEQAMQIMALRSPVALDLRVVVAALKLATTLERVGDLAKSVARRGPLLAGAWKEHPTASILRMGRETQRRLAEALDAFASRDVALAVSVWRRDVEIDELYNALFRELITYMMEDPRTITLGSHYMFIAKNLERIGDHATHVAEMTYFVVEGEPLDEERPRGDRSPVDPSSAESD